MGSGGCNAECLWISIYDAIIPNHLKRCHFWQIGCTDYQVIGPEFHVVFLTSSQIYYGRPIDEVTMVIDIWFCRKCVHNIVIILISEVDECTSGVGWWGQSPTVITDFDLCVAQDFPPGLSLALFHEPINREYPDRVRACLRLCDFNLLREDILRKP